MFKNFVFFVFFSFLGWFLGSYAWAMKNEVFSLFGVWERPQFKEIEDNGQLQEAFIAFLLPKILAENERILFLRDALINNRLSARQIAVLAECYRIKETDTREEFLRRVDIIPPSLVLAQAAAESNWGRSRFAERYHNYFGLWCFKEGCGVVPERRDEGARHEVVRFAMVEQGIAYYMSNLNRHRAYESFRDLRAFQRRSGQALSGIGLLVGLDNYSTSEHYRSTLTSIILGQQLGQYD